MRHQHVFPPLPPLPPLSTAPITFCFIFSKFSVWFILQMDHNFKGTLLLLQNKTKKDPDSYIREFLGQRDHFYAMISTIAGGDSGASQTTTLSSGSSAVTGFANPQFLSVMSYVVHCSHCYPKESAELSSSIINILKASKTTLDPETRMSFVQNLILLRSKDLVTAETTLPLFFDLLLIRDKQLRKTILTHIVSDIRKVNMPGKKNGAKINKAVQNFLFSVVKEDDPIQARKAQLVMIDLYRRNVWADEKTVQVLTSCCFSRHTAIVRTALRFFLLQLPKVSSVDDSEEEDEKDAGRVISKLKQKLKVKKKTKKRSRILGREVKQEKRRYDKEEQEAIYMSKQHVDPIRLLRDPQQFAEQLLQKLQRTSERFDVRILFLSVIARIVCEHNIVILPLYAFLERYMEPTQLHATQLLALSTTCVHRLVPPDAVEPMVRAIANHFVNDRSEPDSITIGINTIREICKRQPLAMNKTLLADLAEYRGQRGDKGVMMAARALIQLYRDVYPDLLPAKMQGTSASAIQRKAIRAVNADGTEIALKSNVPHFGAAKPLMEIPGMELLLQHYAKKAEEGDNGSTLMGGDAETDSDSEFTSDSFETESEAFFSSVHTSDAEEGSVNGDEPPMLVPADKDAKKRLATTTSAAAEKDDLADIESADGDDEEEDSDEDELVEEMESDDDEEEEGADDEEDEDDSSNICIDSDSDESSGEWVEAGSSEESEEEEEENKEAALVDVVLGKKRDRSATPAPGPASAAVTAAHHAVSKVVKPQLTGEGFLEDIAAAPAKKGARTETSLTSSSTPAFLHNTSAANAYAKALDRGIARSQTSNAASTATATGSSMAAVAVLTDEDFARLRKLRQQDAYNVLGPLKGKRKEREERLSKREQLIHTVGALHAQDIESFTVKKRESDKEDKIARTIELRKENQDYNSRKKKKSKLNTTHAEHSKRGKLFQMTKRSAKVASKLKASKIDRKKRDKDNKKKEIKFRINRGWKA